MSIIEGVANESLRGLVGSVNSRLDEFRRQMPVHRKWAYMDHAAVAPLPLPTADAIRAWLDTATVDGDVAWPRWQQQVEAARRHAAGMIHADLTEIALLPNTTSGIHLVAEGYPWQAGDNVVSLDNEFPSNSLPWHNLAARGVELRTVPVIQGRIDLDAIAEACDGRTRVIAASWVGYASGWRLDVPQIAQLAHDRKALLCLDAIQGMGVYPIDVQAFGVDFLAADGHKWMLGPEGAGVFYCRAEHLDRLRPLGLGWHSVENPHHFRHDNRELRRAASRYEGGTQNMCGCIGLAASLKLLSDFGVGPQISHLQDPVLTLGDYAVERLVAIGARVLYERPAKHRTSIITFAYRDRTADVIRRACLDAGIVVSCRGGGVRISLHAYNTTDEIDRLAQVIAAA